MLLMAADALLQLLPLPLSLPLLPLLSLLPPLPAQPASPHQVWLPSSWPSRTMRASIARPWSTCPSPTPRTSHCSTCEPMMKNVARALYSLSMSSASSVFCGHGPSSSVSATYFLPPRLLASGRNSNATPRAHGSRASRRSSSALG